MPYETFTHTHAGFASKLLFGLMFLFALAACQKKEMNHTVNAVKSTTNSDKVLLLGKDNHVLSTGLLDNRSEYILFVENYDKKKDRYVVRYFANESEFENYAAQHLNNPHYRTALDKLHNMQVIRESAIRNGDIYKTDPSQFSDETRALLVQYGAIRSDNTAHRGIGVLYDKRNFNGSTYPLLPYNWSYGWFRNRAESVTIFADDAVLCDKRWFRGAKVFIIGFPVGNFDLWRLHFANRAESNF